ncbi:MULTISPECIES: GIY-YIG nuclease family protein [Nguyenibacter]|uniref:GIY-YIG nuclease family protein n=1 Tax=Nguyenibacter vanlangensis TaxID=1216886 RepID=A0A7Y7M5S9_9PROT|nr:MULTISPECIES: GIY-YIG nuclease family protein [Nguyenibacter]NVN12235.1 GIY-YIG nuclease family protein [Nguyenibacter vanlangensis]WRH86669.1 GIY-YIG nuclease family protein [Nguyenibacter sp. L1]
MDRMKRRESAREYKERKVVAGIYAMRCRPTNQVWVGDAPDLSTIENRIRFTLRLGTNPCTSLQQAWDVHGTDGLLFEIIEAVAPDAVQHLRNGDLKRRLEHWVRVLEATRM